MKVLHAMAGASVGGAETFFADALEAVNETDIQQRVVTRDNNTHKIKLMKRLGIPFDTAGFGRVWPWPTKQTLKKVMNQFHPDIVHYWMGRAGMFCAKTPVGAALC